MKKEAEETTEEIKIAELKADLVLMKDDWMEIIEGDEDYDAKEDIFLATMANLQDELKGLQDTQVIDKLDIRKKARIFSDMQMLAGLLDQFAYGDDEDLEEEDFEFELDEDEEE